ncbi:MAG TPA: HlyD family secretion protein [Stellaceae bacterium]|nr:HlyD family secretion protein [Stellaceae bacterium]
MAARPEPVTRPSRGGRRLLRFGLLFLLAFLLIGLGVAYWIATRDLESTDDAFIDGDLASIIPRVAGPVVALHITDNQPVREGELLLEIDPRDYATAVASARANHAAAQAQGAVAAANIALARVSTGAIIAQAEAGVQHAQAALAQARAQVGVAEAEQARARDDEERYQKLVASDYASRQRFEQARAQARSADAQTRAAHEAVQVAAAQLGEAQGKLDEAKDAPQQIAVRAAEQRLAEAQEAGAKAALEQAELNLSYTKITAPHDGIITKRSVREGDVVQKDQELAALVFGTPWVTANFKETQLSRMRPGQKVRIIIDAYPGLRLAGHIDSIQRGTGARFSLLPPENATGNFVKVVQRVPVKIVFDEALPPGFVWGPGMSVVPTVDVGEPP